MARPSPVPPYRRVVEVSTWLKTLNKRSNRSAGIPMPVSRTATRTSRREPSRARADTATATSPAWVNLMALARRFQVFPDAKSGAKTGNPWM
jgi:hypothetical protein